MIVPSCVFSLSFIHFREECESYVKGFPGARFKKFSSNDEAKSFVGGSDSGFSNNYSYTTPTSYVSIFLLSIEYINKESKSTF